MATLERTITIGAELRPCYVDGKKALFHKWTESDYKDKTIHGIIQVDTRLKEKAIQRLKDKISRGEYTPVGKIEVLRTLRAVVEYEDGKIEEVAPTQICFADNKIREYAFSKESEVNPNCAAPSFRKGSPPPDPKRFYCCPNCGEQFEVYNGDILKEGKMKFETDYIISWDISDKDFPAISIIKLLADKDNNLTCDVVGISHEKSGVVSLRQLLEEKSAEEKAKYREAFELLSTLPTCNTCVKQKICKFVNWGGKVVYNCPHYAEPK